MNAAGVGSALGLLGLEFIELGEHIDKDAEVVFLEPLQGRGVVQEDVGVEHVVFHELRGCREAEIAGCRSTAARSFLPRAASFFWNFFKQCGLTFLGAMNHRYG